MAENPVRPVTNLRMPPSSLAVIMPDKKGEI